MHEAILNDSLSKHLRDWRLNPPADPRVRHTSAVLVATSHNSESAKPRRPTINGPGLEETALGPVAA